MSQSVATLLTMIQCHPLSAMLQLYRPSVISNASTISEYGHCIHEGTVKFILSRRDKGFDDATCFSQVQRIHERKVGRQLSTKEDTILRNSMITARKRQKLIYSAEEEKQLSSSTKQDVISTPPVPVADSPLPDFSQVDHEGLANTEPTVPSIQNETPSFTPAPLSMICTIPVSVHALLIPDLPFVDTTCPAYNDPMLNTVEMAKLPSSSTQRDFPDNEKYLSLPEAPVSVKTCLERKLPSEDIRDITSVENMKECKISLDSSDILKLCYYSQIIHRNLEKSKDKEMKHPFKYTPNLWKIACELWDTTKYNGQYGNEVAYELRLKDEKLLHCAYFICGDKNERIYVDPMRLEGDFFLDHSTVIIDKHRFFEYKRKTEHKLFMYMILTCKSPEKTCKTFLGLVLY